jgi:hypothetical protein
MTSKPIPVQVRRLVTGQSAAGLSYIESDGPAPAVMRPAGQPNVMSNDVWRTYSTPARIDAPDPTVVEGYKCELKPPENGTVFRVLWVFETRRFDETRSFRRLAHGFSNYSEFPPDKERNYAAQSSVFSQYGAASAHDSSAAPRHPAMHTTCSVDYAIVLSGEIWAVMDEGETLMKAGDVLVQRGTNHAWSNRSTEPARLAFVLVDGV